MGSEKQTADDIRWNLTEQLDWRVAERNDVAVAQALQRGEAVDAVHTLDEAGLLDGFFVFLKETGVMNHWSTFTIEAVKRVFLPSIFFLLLYGTRVLFGIESTNALPALLFSNVAVMTLVGFNAHQVAEGMTRRGAHLRTEASDYTLMDPQTLAETICKTSARELEHLFNGTIHCLAAFGVFVAEAMIAVDGTQVVTTESFQACGCLRVTKWKHNRQGLRIQTTELLFGWRLIALIDLVTLIPLAIKIVQIQRQESPYLLELVQQAQANLAPFSRIRWLVADRAYVDGPTLYALDRMGITFIVIAKSNMAARRTALALSVKAPLQRRVETVRHGHGRQAWTEEWVTCVQAATGIRSWPSYRPPVVQGRRLKWQDRPTLNAVVVSLWRNNQPSKDGPRVFLTNGSVENPWAILDGYDDRSWIENGLFRNSKQFWRLTRWFPEKTEAGVHSHLTFVTLILAVATAYRLWDKAQAGAVHQVWDHQIEATTYQLIAADTGEVTDVPAPCPPSTTHLASVLPSQPTAGVDSNPEPKPSLDVLAHSLLGGQGVLRWRRQLEQENRDKVIVFIDHQYGIFDTHELLVLSGVPVRTLPPHLGSREDILRRYGCHFAQAPGPPGPMPGDQSAIP
ncbi:MAG: transposase [Chloroflexi bacterium]|nr:transposase [Chloroflexota bacterium]